MDRGPVPMHMGAILELDPASAPAAETLARALGARFAAVPRLRRRLVRTPPGCGRAVWSDDPRFAVDRHLRVRNVAPDADGSGADEAGLVRARAAGLLTRRLPRDRPLWRAEVLAAPGGRAVAVVVVVHHAVADGVGGLAVLGALTDAGAEQDAAVAPVGQPSRRLLAADAWARRAHRLAHAEDSLRTVVGAVRELGLGRPRLAGRSSLLSSRVSCRRTVDVVETDLGDVARAGHRLGVTVNDLVLVAVSGALGWLVRSRGEDLGSVVVSVPVSARAETSVGRLGNQVGVAPVDIPLGSRELRLAAVAAQTARLRGPGGAAGRGASAAVLAPVFRLLGAVRLFSWIVHHQRLVHTFESNLRGPTDPVLVAGARVRRIVPMAVNPGNVTVSFDVLSYAGRLVVTVLSDPEHVPEHRRLASRLAAELVAVGRMGAGERPTASR